MVEIFKTNINDPVHAERIVTLLNNHFPSFRINFDLHDCDNILRVKGDAIPVEKIITLVSENGFLCSVLN